MDNTRKFPDINEKALQSSKIDVKKLKKRVQEKSKQLQDAKPIRK